MLALTVAGLAFNAGIRTAPSPITARVAVPTLCAAPAAPVATTAAKPLKPPANVDEMLQQAAKAVDLARADGKNRFILRLFLPKDREEANLYPTTLLAIRDRCLSALSASSRWRELISATISWQEKQASVAAKHASD